MNPPAEISIFVDDRSACEPAAAAHAACRIQRVAFDRCVRCVFLVLSIVIACARCCRRFLFAALIDDQAIVVMFTRRADIILIELVAYRARFRCACSGRRSFTCQRDDALALSFRSARKSRTDQISSSVRCPRPARSHICAGRRLTFSRQ